MRNYDEESMQNFLMELIAEGESSGIDREEVYFRTYEDAGVMTYNKGLVVTLPDGSEFQITIVKSY